METLPEKRPEDITPEISAKAVFVIDRIQNDIIYHTAGVYWLKATGAWLEYAHPTWDRFCQKVLGISRRQADNLVLNMQGLMEHAIAKEGERKAFEKLEAVVLSEREAVAGSVKFLQSGEGEVDPAEGNTFLIFRGFTGASLRAISKLNQEHFDSLVEDGQITDVEGNVFTKDDIEGMVSHRVEELTKNLNAGRKGLRRRLDKAEEEASKMRAERKADAEALKKAQVYSDENMHMRRTLGGELHSYESRRDTLQDIQSTLDKCIEQVVKIGLTDEDDPYFHQLAASIAGKVKILREHTLHNFMTSIEIVANTAEDVLMDVEAEETYLDVTSRK